MAAARQSKPDQSVTKDMLKIKGLSDPGPRPPEGQEKTLGSERLTGQQDAAAAAGRRRGMISLGCSSKQLARQASRSSPAVIAAVKGFQRESINCERLR
jgi:hypothetical protein